MIEQLTEKRMVEQEVVYRQRCYCDICGKRIFTQDSDLKITDITSIKEYYEITTGDYDFGHDPYDSIKKQIVCPECLDSLFQAYKEGASSCSKQNTRYFNADHGWHYDDEPDGPEFYAKVEDNNMKVPDIPIGLIGIRKA